MHVPWSHWATRFHVHVSPWTLLLTLGSAVINTCWVTKTWIQANQDPSVLLLAVSCLATAYLVGQARDRRFHVLQDHVSKPTSHGELDTGLAFHPWFIIWSGTSHLLALILMVAGWAMTSCPWSVWLPTICALVLLVALDGGRMVVVSTGHETEFLEETLRDHVFFVADVELASIRALDSKTVMTIGTGCHTQVRRRFMWHPTTETVRVKDEDVLAL